MGIAGLGLSLPTMKAISCLTKISLPATVAVSVFFVIMPLTGGEQPKFETASVKTIDRCVFQNSVDPGMVALNGDPLSVLLTEAFKMKRDQIIGPSWLDTDCITVNAKMPEGATKDQLPEMFHELLIERFKLASHTETRLRSGYALVLDKNGPKLTESDPNSPSARLHAGQVMFGFAAHPRIKGAMTIGSLSHQLSNKLEAPVQDLTGLSGIYDIDLSWAPDHLGPSAQDAGASIPSAAENDVFAAVRESLGLRLERRKLQVEVVVIDHIERVPTPN